MTIVEPVLLSNIIYLTILYILSILKDFFGNNHPMKHIKAENCCELDRVGATYVRPKLLAAIIKS